MAILQFIEIILGRANSYKKNRIIRKQKTHETVHPRSIEVHPDFFNKQKDHSSSGSANSGNKIEVTENYEEFSDAVDAKNLELIESDSKYRFSVSKSEGEISLSIHRLKETGEIVEINKKNITHDNYYEWIRHIEKGEGFFIDESE